MRMTAAEVLKAAGMWPPNANATPKRREKTVEEIRDEFARWERRNADKLDKCRAGCPHHAASYVCHLIPANCECAKHVLRWWDRGNGWPEGCPHEHESDGD